MEKGEKALDMTSCPAKEDKITLVKLCLYLLVSIPNERLDVFGFLNGAKPLYSVRLSVSTLKISIVGSTPYVSALTNHSA